MAQPTAHTIVKPTGALPIVALLIGASIWGILWYPYRLLAQEGVGGGVAALITYGVAALAGLLFFPRAVREWLPHPWLFLAMGLAAGISNVSR